MQSQCRNFKNIFQLFKTVPDLIFIFNYLDLDIDCNIFLIFVFFLQVWVWEREELVRIVLSQPPELIVGRQDRVMTVLSTVTDGVAVVDEIRYHIDTDNSVNREW